MIMDLELGDMKKITANFSGGDNGIGVFKKISML